MKTFTITIRERGVEHAYTIPSTDGEAAAALAYRTHCAQPFHNPNERAEVVSTYEQPAVDPAGG